MTAELPTLATLHALARAVAGLPGLPDTALPEPYAAILDAVEAAEKAERTGVLHSHLESRGLDAAAIVHGMLALDPAQPPPEPKAHADPGRCPDLPAAALLDPHSGNGVAPWLDLYVKYASARSPMTPRIFHESAGLWLLSVAVARRLCIDLGFGILYPNLWIAWIAPTTVDAKSTGLGLAADEMARTVFPWLLASGNTTVEALYSDFSGEQPRNLDLLPQEYQDHWKSGRAFSGQRGVVMDEMSMLMSVVAKDYNAGLSETYLNLYSCLPELSRSTRGQGLLIIRRGYLSFIGASTPKAMAPFFAKPLLWTGGWWPRFALLTREGSPAAYKKAVDPPGMRMQVEKSLYDVYRRLPIPEWPKAPEAMTVGITPEALAAWEAYDKALRYDMAAVGPDLDDEQRGSYGRLPTQLLRVAMLISLLDWPTSLPAPTIAIPHLARAQEIVEGWRSSLHRVLEMGEESDYTKLRGRVLRVLASEEGWVTFRAVCQGIRNKSPNEVKDVLSQLVMAGELDEQPGQNKSGPKSTQYRYVG